MSDSESRFQQLVPKLKARNNRISPQRVALLRLIAASKEHPSASHLYDQIRTQVPTTSAATVYKTFNFLKELDEVLELGFSQDDNRYDGNRPCPHPHLVCTHCRSIVDLKVRSVDDLAAEVARRSGYQIVSHRLDFYGLCRDCLRGQPQTCPSARPDRFPERRWCH